jgi:ABC-type antimicrobial peptide transport system permease subunit
MTTLLLWVLGYGLLAFLLALALFVVVMLALSVVLLVVIFLQFAGAIRGVPLSYNVRNLVVRWRVTLLTALAFTLVVGLMIVMLAFVNGLYKLTEGSSHAENIIVLSDGAIDELFSNLGFGDITEIEYIPKEVNGRLVNVPVSWEVYVVINHPIKNAAKGARQRRFVQVRGLVDPARSGFVHHVGLHEGSKWFSTAGAQSRKRGDPTDALVQAVLGEGIARELGHDLGKPTLEVGDEFELGPRTWVVTGILASSGSTFDSEIWTKRQIVSELFGKDGCTTVVMRTPDGETAKSVAKDLTENYKKPAVQATLETEYYDKLNATNQQFLYSIVFVTIIMAIGGVFGVMNTMFAAISQRTKDIGVLRILGYSRWQVLVSFFMESLLLAIVGGLLGCALGSLANGYTATSILSSGQGGGKTVMLKLVVDGRILMTGMLFAIGMGCVGGLIPALSAMRLRPLESLR